MSIVAIGGTAGCGDSPAAGVLWPHLNVRLLLLEVDAVATLNAPWWVTHARRQVATSWTHSLTHTIDRGAVAAAPPGLDVAARRVRDWGRHSAAHDAGPSGWVAGRGESSGGGAGQRSGGGAG